MGLLNSIRPGELGTPEQQKVFTALARFADAASTLTPLALVSYPQVGASLASQANLADVGEMSRTIRLQLENADGEIQTWFNGHCDLTPTEVIVDAQAAAPTVVGGNAIQFVNGAAEYVITYDTDLAATKGYAAGDTATITPAMDNVLGVAVDVSDAVFVDTFEAPRLISTPKTAASSAAVANAAMAGTLHRYMNLKLTNSLGDAQPWFNGPVILTASEVIVDGSCAAPTVIGGTPQNMVAGELVYGITYDTDEAVTKGYAAGDTATVTVTAANIGGVAVTVGANANLVDTFVA